MWQRWTVTLTPESLEDAYRLHALRRDRRTLVAVLLVAAIFNLANIPTDASFHPPGDTTNLLVAIRLAGVAIALIAMRMLVATRDPRQLDRIATVWGVLQTAALTAGNVLLPADYTLHAVWDVLVVLAMYVVVPISIPRQMAIAMIMSVGDVVLFAGYRELGRPLEFREVVLAHLCAHAIGVIASWQSHRGRREQYLALRDAEAAHTQEIEVRRELESLQGILRICSSCKRIHTADGDWDQVDVYLTEHSDARFSHGICPECSARLYGES